ncbi:MAG: DNA polymerase III subunit alpha [Gemmatimonas sp.]|uniref:DNA polymerase III subunit alpha n=1 Tax=Gemmatimonas sp. TaxID=1962908 RepID=UPI00391FAACE
MSFVHLHCHSEYSLLDGANRIDDLIKRAQHFEMPALAITDHGNMHAAWEFQEKARKAGVKPILGMEAYVAPGDRRQRGRPAPGVKPYYHLVLLARDLVGYRNLVKLTSLGYTEGFYTKPRIDRELLAAHSEGLIVSSACLAGEVAGHLMDDRLEQAREAAAWYAELFKGRYYLEVQAHTSEGQATLNAKILSLGDDLGLPVIATNDAHFLKHEDHDAHDVLLCIGLGKDRHDRDRMKYDDGLYFKSADEIRPFFPGREDVLTNTLAIADAVGVQFAKKYYVPSFPLPAGVETENDLLVQLATAGAKERYGDPLPQAVQERLDYELGVITKTGYAGYFLITADFIKAARDRGIPVGPGRGSAAGSLVAYATRITDVCPLEFDLLFERFLNPERVSMPDVDVDFCFERRGEVIEYVRQKYGKDSVGQIVTFGTMKSRAAIKDVGRTLGFTPAETDALAKLIPNAPNHSLTVKEAIEQVPEVKSFYQNDERYRQLLDFAVKLEGLSRHTGVHAAGVVIAPGPLDDFVPICTQATKGSGSDGDERVIVTQYDMTALEKAGMLKMDFLGLTTLTVISDTLRNIKERHGIEVTLEERGFTDEKTYQVLRAGRTGGVFQFESPLATDVLKRMRCDRFDDLVASNALLRPGPLDAGMHNVYIRRKRGEEPTVYALPELEPILSNTYGVITYQEQVMRIAQVLAGISLAEADVLRKAVGKKDAELIKKELGTFTEKAVAKGYDPKIIDELAGQIETFGRYGFNKCLVGDTEIYDAASGRLVRIADVFEGRATLGAVATCDVDTLRLGEGRVVDVVDNGIKPVFRLRTESGREIVATVNHPFLMIDGWRLLDSITICEHLACPSTLPVTGSRVEWPAHEVIALGHLLAEGNLGHPSGVYYDNQDEASVADFIAAAEQFANVRCTRTTHKGTASIYTGRIDRTASNGIFAWARSLDLLGKVATNKEIPAAAFDLSNAHLGLLLGRMWDGDGHVNAGDRSTYFATSSKRLAHQVQHVLLRLGILGRIRQVEFSDRGGQKTGYQVFVTGAENLRPFVELIGMHLVAPAKRAAMAAMPLTAEPGPSKDRVPVGPVRALARAARASRGETWEQVEVGADVSARDLYPVGTNPAKIGFTRGVVNRLAQYFDDAALQRLGSSDVLWDRVVSIEPAGEERTYDLEIADTHNFVANDLVVHNSHSVAYSVVAYHTAYLKTHYPAEFMAALLSSNIGKTEEIIKYIAEAREMGLEVLAPDVNESGWRFTVVGDRRIRFGLGAIRNVGRGAIDSLLAARADGPFASLYDLCARIDLRLCNKRVFEALIAAGACDALGGHRAQLVAALDAAISEAALQQEEAERGQGSLFGDLMAEPEATGNNERSGAPTLPSVPTWTESERLQREKELLGFYISGHPLEPYRTECELFATHTVSQLGTWTGDKVTIGVVVTAIRKQISKRSGAEFARLTVEDFSGSSEVLVFPEAWGVIAERVRPDVPLLLAGGYSRKDQDVESATFIVDTVTRFAEVRASGEVAVAIDLAPGLDLPPAIMDDVRARVEAHEGSAPLELRWRDGDGKPVRFRSKSLTVTASPAILSDLRALLGADRVRLVRTGG